LATLITPYGEQFAVTPLDFEAGFTKEEIDKLIQGDAKAFCLKTGAVLLLDSLMCVAGDGERNYQANCLLRTAIHDPGGEVCGWALLLGHEESSALSQSLHASLRLDRGGSSLTVLLLDRNEEVRAVIAEGLARAHFRVVQARTVDEVLSFCESYSMHLLVADVSSLRPTPLKTLDAIRKSQSQSKIVLISGFDLSTVAFVYPALLTGVEFLQKPFELNVMTSLAHWLTCGKNTSEQHERLLVANTDSS
jgi:ActR/RegA family two-component response regulator